MATISCKTVVKLILVDMGLHYTAVELGEIEIEEDISCRDLDVLKAALRQYDLELINDRKAILIEKIKNVIIEMVQNMDELPCIKYSYYLSKKMNLDYTYFSNLFSDKTGITIEQYIIVQKVERVKKLLTDDKLTLTEISFLLHYSSVAHLCSQFKKTTGHTPKFFKIIHQQRLTGIKIF